MTNILTMIMIFFWILLLFYSAVTISGLWYRVRYKHPPPLEKYPSVALFIPAYNEGVVISDTLSAMGKLNYPGKLDIYLLDDGSKDDTADISKEFSEAFANIHYIPVPDGEPRGKSRVLNYGLKISSSDYFIVYDADNQPEADAVTKLVEAAETTNGAAGAVGYVKTQNKETNMLTRMIALEFRVFQLLMQCGRWSLFKLGSLAGTNMLLRRKVIEELGGYDVYALAEDAELTVRLTAAGYLLPVVPTSCTWEQEPENLKVFIKQRTRWLTGNIYLLEKSLREFSFWKGRTFILSLQHLLTYAVFIGLLLFSHIFFLLSILGLDLPNIAAPLLMLWFMSYIVYSAQLLSAIVIDDDITLRNVAYVFIMYFTYAQLFVILLIRSMYIYIKSRMKGQTVSWDKTQRFKQTEM
ncbi:glycosyltransferase [Bacillus mesophilum]|uniref:Glycosyltransferase family 2 protein n=1 Tax=Bacillus mesophilum TaxID=1071718 RepID=A0A7V7RME5_9BACI|nr:glycosyltransferase [Bacillus mesophilum]KAB2333498.1 glycosyltransferase family 2 protein [Bacillus mesophilum]